METNLREVDGVGKAVADRLTDAGYGSLEDIKNKNAEIEDLKEAGAPKNASKNLVRQARQRAVTIQSGEEVRKEFDEKDKIPTGIQRLDDALEGGWESGYVVAIGGETGAGKTQMIFQSCGRAVEATEKPAVYIETERGRYRGERIRQMFNKEIQDEVYKVSAYDIEQMKTAYRTVMEQFDELSLVAIDSFTSRFRLNEEFSGRESFTSRSDEMGQQLTTIEDMAAGLDIPVLATCQVYEAPTQYQPEPIIYGGSLMLHTVNFVIKLMDKSGALSNLLIRNHPGQSNQEFGIQINEDGVTADPS
jgi:RecA/RadA recombinase